MGKIYYNGVDYSTAVVSGVLGIKGNAETTYRTGNVNITPANIGLGNVNNTADSAKSVKYATTAGSATPTAHASTATTYGKSTGSNYGHAKLSDTYTSSVGDASSGVAASQKALFDAYSTLNSNIGVINLGFDDTKADSWKQLVDKKIDLIKSKNTQGVFCIEGGWSGKQYGITLGQNNDGNILVYILCSDAIYTGYRLNNGDRAYKILNLIQD